jgi:hypothetical protein
MNPFRLVRVRGPQQEESWQLPADRQVVIGRYDPRRPTPDIDLTPDIKVSRRHGLLWYEHDEWWFKDESTNGVRIAGQKVRGGDPIRIDPGEEIQVGDTILMVVSPHWHQLRGRDGSLSVEFVLTPAINFSLIHCGVPVVSRLVVRNWATQQSAPGTLTITIEECGNSRRISIPPLQPAQSQELPLPEFHWDARALEARTERVSRVVSVQLDGQALAGEQIDCWLLAYNEWAQVSEHRVATAAFVLPNHPLVTQVGFDACSHLGNEGTPKEILAAVYTHLFTHWSLTYLPEPPSWESASQKIRLPHQVLLDTIHKRGQGTCIDLALLLAACLEHVGVQPLIALLDMGVWWHALVGCWDQPRANLEPILVEKQRTLKGVLWVDPLGCTQSPLHRRTFPDICAAAEQFLENNSFLFAVDIAAARVIEGIRPLPFAGEPGLSTTVSTIVLQARNYAQETGQRVGTVPLLLSLVTAESRIVRELCERCHIQPVQAEQQLMTGLRRLRRSHGADHATTRHYEQALTTACSLARWEGSPLILEQHVLMALLETPSSALDRALAALRTNRQELLAVLQQVREDPSWPSVFSDCSSQF